MEKKPQQKKGNNQQQPQKNPQQKPAQSPFGAPNKSNPAQQKKQGW